MSEVCQLIRCCHLHTENTETFQPIRELTNPTMDTPSRELPRELLLSHKRVLHSGEKPELQRRLEKRRMDWHREQEQALQPPSDLEQELHKRQLKLKQYEQEEVKKKVDQENVPEFVRVKEKLHPQYEQEVKRRLDQASIPEFVLVKEKLRHIQASGQCADKDAQDPQPLISPTPPQGP